MRAIADDQGKVHFAATVGDVQITFAINGDGGVPFASGQEVEIADELIASLTQKLLASFGAAAVPITESA